MNSRRDALAFVAFVEKLHEFFEKGGWADGVFRVGEEFFCEKKVWGNNIAWGFAL